MKCLACLVSLSLALFSFGLIGCGDSGHSHSHGSDHSHDGDHGHHHDEDGHAHHENDGDGEGHEHTKVAGPTGGRLLLGIEPHLEFFVNADRKIEIRISDDEGKELDLGEPVVTAIGGERANPTRMRFAKQGNALVSDVPFPEGNQLPVVIQFKASPEAEMQTEKFNVDFSECPTCPYIEYACICDHDH